jgi:hypothetical protein
MGEKKKIEKARESARRSGDNTMRRRMGLENVFKRLWITKEKSCRRSRHNFYHAALEEKKKDFSTAFFTIHLTYFQLIPNLIPHLLKRLCEKVILETSISLDGCKQQNQCCCKDGIFHVHIQSSAQEGRERERAKE